MIAMSAIPLGPATLTLMRIVIFTVNLATTTLGMGVEGLLAHRTHPDERGRAGGWFQAGNLGGAGIGGGAGLWLATQLPEHWMSGAVIGLVFALCAIPAFIVDDVPAESEGKAVSDAVAGVFKDLLGLVLAAVVAR
ncbi:MAG: hypothetical protein HYV07_25320 [Deltaproteobacteria bacterium]|nr:hypothetical protein [Deltaproteobacteria bacterium]